MQYCDITQNYVKNTLRVCLVRRKIFSGKCFLISHVWLTLMIWKMFSKSTYFGREVFFLKFEKNELIWKTFFKANQIWKNWNQINFILKDESNLNFFEL